MTMQANDVGGEWLPLMAVHGTVKALHSFAATLHMHNMSKTNTTKTSHSFYPTLYTDMAPHKAKARGHQPQAPPQPSDYETDAPPPALDVPLPPPRSNEELNFSVLQRTYPELIAIEHVTPFAALYVFNLETQAWEKVGVEGTLFICQLTPSDIGAERYCAAILNRKGLDNFYLELTSSENMEIDDPYIIVQGEQGEQVYGLWIFADPPPATTANCRVECAKKIMEIADRAQASREAKGGVGNNGLKQATEQTEAASSEPMGRQLSLRQLFGQQREQDAGISANSHNSHPPQHAYTQQQAYNPGPAQQDVLGQLFMKAKHDYNGFG
jgi:hypothetical protein